MTKIIDKAKSYISSTLNQNRGALKHLLTTFMLSSIANIFTVAFYFIMSRKLGPESYSAFAVLLAIFQIASVTAGVVSIVIIKYISYFKAKSQYDKISMLLNLSIKYLFASGFLVFLLLSIFSQDISDLFNLNSRFAVVLLGLFIWSFLFITSLLSALNGLQRYFTLGLNRIFEAIATLILGILFVYLLRLNVNGAVLAMFLGAVATIPFCLGALKNIIMIKKTPLGKIGLMEYIILATLISSLIGIMLNIDVMMVKSFFDETESGFYGATSLVGSIVFFISSALNTIIFPKVSELYSNGEDTSEYLRFGLFWTTLGCSIVIISYFLFPSFIVNIAVGNKYNISSYIGIYSIAMSLLALTNVIVVYNLAIKKWNILYVLFPALFIEMLLIFLFHQSIQQVIIIVLIFNILLLVALLILCNDQIKDIFYIKKGYKKYPSSLSFRLLKNT